MVVQVPNYHRMDYGADIQKFTGVSIGTEVVVEGKSRVMTEVVRPHWPCV